MDFIFLGSKSLQMVTTAMKLKDTCHLEEKKAKTVTNLDSVFKTKHYFSNKGVYLVKALVFPVVMYGCESWTINKAEHRRTASFELRYWRRLLRVSCTARRSYTSTLKEISPEYSVEGLMLKLKFQYFGHLI